jgi:hypothetical protein
MGDLCEPNDDLLEKMVAPYLRAQPRGLGFAIGYASPSFANYGRVRVFGNVQNQFGADLCLSCETPFALVITNDLLLHMQGKPLPADKSAYPRSGRAIGNRA